MKNKEKSRNDLNLRRLNELNSRLREDLERPRIKADDGTKVAPWSSTKLCVDQCIRGFDVVSSPPFARALRYANLNRSLD